MNRFSVFLCLWMAFVSNGSWSQSDSCSRQEVFSVIQINAPVDSVWNALLAVDEYAQWNPFIMDIDGTIQQRKMVKITVKLRDGSIKTFRAKIQKLQKGYALEWGGSLLFFFKAKHYFYLKPTDGQTTELIQGEYWKGWFGKTYGRNVFEDACFNFQQMNQALKTRLESEK